MMYFRGERYWNRVYDVLHEECGADDSNYERKNFVRQQMEKDFPMEFRFCGFLGFGGKFWRNQGRMYVSCYEEDMTPSRKLNIDAANKRLEKM